MSRRTPTLEITEINGIDIPDLHTAQARALEPIAADLARTMRRLLALGILLEANGRIIPNPERMQTE